MDAASFERVYDSLQEFQAFFAASFGRKQWREHSGNYLQALLVQDQERRNAENLSESVGISARAMQRFLTEARWSDDDSHRAVAGIPGPQAGASRRPCGCSTAATFPSRGGNRREWPGSTAAGWARWPTARPGCSWPTSARWAGRWWTNGCICRRAGLRTMPGVQAAGVPVERCSYRS